jgi:hypothetical protein
MIVDRIVMVEGAHQGEVAPVDPATITHHKIAQRNPIQQRLVHTATLSFNAIYAIIM